MLLRRPSCLLGLHHQFISNMASNALILPLPRGTFTEEGIHPSCGGNPYSDDYRHDVITRFLMGFPLDNPELNALRAIYTYPSIWTCERYIERWWDYGHVQPMRATGNHDAEREIRGQPLIRLALYRSVFPKCSIDQIRAFLFNMDPTIVPYSPSQVVRGEQLLSLRKKKASTTCERAYWPINLHKRRNFWTRDYPFGCRNIRTQDMIDMDQAGFKIEGCNPSFGKTVSCLRCDDEGQYNRDAKLNMMMAISADDAYDMEWHWTWKQEEGGTTIWIVYSFFLQICDQLDIDHPGRRFCFTMDNLNIHHSPIIVTLLISRGHDVLYRAPYWSVDGPMEYVFNTIHVFLLMFYNAVHDLDELEVTLDHIIDVHVYNFSRYFHNVGFSMS